MEELLQDYVDYPKSLKESTSTMSFVPFTMMYYSRKVVVPSIFLLVTPHQTSDVLPTCCTAESYITEGNVI